MVDAPPTRMRRRIANALTLLRKGRIGPDYRAPFDIVLSDRFVTLRRYRATTSSQTPSEGARAVLLVPPLMVTSQIYDISPELSAVAYLAGRGVPVYVADFGAPEALEGGLDRTLDDHVLAVSRCIDALVGLTGKDVHLIGYSQGGMFCYQAAAYRKSAGIASLVTFGAPVDIRRNVPFKLNDKLAEKLITGMRRVIGRPLEGMRGLPGTLSSRGFKLMAPLGELRHLVQLFGILHDEEALARLEPKRRFLGGEGFTAWPGPALRTFIDEFVVGNRMKQGGFVIAGRTVALADITSPICYVLGEDDDLALPDAVRAIREAAPRAHSYPVHVPAGHFGLVVGRAALSVCWPTVVAWTAWQDGRGERPAILDTAAEPSNTGVASGLGDAIWEGMGKLGLRLGRVSDTVRWQFPRVLRRTLMELAESAGGDAHVSLSRTLRDRAANLPNAVCFVYAGRAYTFADADKRVDEIARALQVAGIGVGQRVAVVMHAHPDALTAVMALNRLGAVAVPVAESTIAETISPDEVPNRVTVTLLVCALTHRAAAREAFAGQIALIGRGERPHDGDVIDLEAPPTEPAVATVEEAEGRMHDEAAVMTRAAGEARSISNREWVLAGLDLAIGARLTTADTLYCPHSLAVPALGLALAAALAGGARMQLGEPRHDDLGSTAAEAAVSQARIWDELMNSGATVVLADDELARALADLPLPERHSVRLVLGDGLSSEIAAALVDRLGRRTRYRPLASLIAAPTG